MRKTHALIQVALALLEDPDGQYWGYDVSRRSGVRAGALYPILHRMLDEGWLEDGWEDQGDGTRKRPPRRFYTLTDDGRSKMRALVNEALEEPRFAALRGATT